MIYTFLQKHFFKITTAISVIIILCLTQCNGDNEKEIAKVSVKIETKTADIKAVSDKEDKALDDLKTSGETAVKTSAKLIKELPQRTYTPIDNKVDGQCAEDLDKCKETAGKLNNEVVKLNDSIGKSANSLSDYKKEKAKLQREKEKLIEEKGKLQGQQPVFRLNATVELGNRKTMDNFIYKGGLSIQDKQGFQYSLTMDNNSYYYLGVSIPIITIKR